MAKGKRQFEIQNQTVDQVKLTLQEFENKYQSYKGRWAYEQYTQKDNTVIAQLVDHGFESPRGKGQSDSPYLYVTLTQKDGNVLADWAMSWKRSKRNLSWTMFWILVISRFIIFLAVHGDKVVLYAGIWAFCLILYAAWLAQNHIHERAAMDIFREMLERNFGGPGGYRKDEKLEPEETREPSDYEEPEQML